MTGLLPIQAAEPRSRAQEKPWIFVLLWALSWAGIGFGVGLMVSFAQGGTGAFSAGGLGWYIVQLSILFAEVVGITAIASSRLIFPYYARLPYLPRVLLQVATLLAGSIMGSIVTLVTYPLFTLHQGRLIIMMVVINAALALAVGIAVHTYETLRAQIERSYIELRKKEAYDREMEIAREVQEQLFPKSVPQVRGLELAGLCLPAAGVGGDYYDYLPLSEDRIGLVVADVSGKGISAALVMASLQASVRILIGPEAEPAKVNCRLNHFLYRSTSAARYATMFFGLLDVRDMSLRYSNAGHNPAMVIGRTGSHKLTEGGLPLGILDGVSYGEGRRTLEPGDLLLLYTDGAVEAADPAGREFSLDRLVGFMQERREARDLSGLVREALAEVNGWTRGSSQQDDITLVVARAVA